MLRGTNPRRAWCGRGGRSCLESMRNEGTRSGAPLPGSGSNGPRLEDEASGVPCQSGALRAALAAPGVPGSQRRAVRRGVTTGDGATRTCRRGAIEAPRTSPRLSTTARSGCASTPRCAWNRQARVARTPRVVVPFEPAPLGPGDVGSCIGFETGGDEETMLRIEVDPLEPDVLAGRREGDRARSPPRRLHVHALARSHDRPPAPCSDRPPRPGACTGGDPGRGSAPVDPAGGFRSTGLSPDSGTILSRFPPGSAPCRR